MAIKPIKNMMQYIADINETEIMDQLNRNRLELWCKDIRRKLNDCLVQMPFKFVDWIPCDKELPGLSVITTAAIDSDTLDVSEPVQVTFIGFHDGKPYVGETPAVIGDDGEWYWWFDEGEKLEHVRVEITAWKPFDHPYRGHTI